MINPQAPGLSDEEIDSLFFGARNPASTVEGFRLSLRAVIAEDRANRDEQRQFAGWFREHPSAMSYRLWEQGDDEQQDGEVALYE